MHLVVVIKHIKCGPSTKYQNVTSFSNEDCLNNLVLKPDNLTFSSASFAPAEESLKLPYENSPVLVAPFLASSKIVIYIVSSQQS